MKLTVQTAVGAVFSFAALPCLASSHHRHHHPIKRHDHGAVHSVREVGQNEDRSVGTCPFPSGQGLVKITPGKLNAGWALSPDQPCKCGSYCPYACPPGQVMAQWKDGSTYATEDRMAGGLFCGFDGVATKPFKNKPLCVDGTGSVSAVNTCGKVVSFCQTVLPGNEDIIIPTDVYDTAVLAVPDPSYWQSTASHFYINGPGIDSNKGCHWGDPSQPIGNWAYYVAGANENMKGETFVKVGVNPINKDSSWANVKPDFGLKIECPGGGCVGLPCAVDGNGVVSNLKATGAGDADFCVVTVPKGGKANIVVYNLDGSTGSVSTSSSSSSKAPPTTSSTPPPSSTSTSTSIKLTSTSTTSTTSSTSSSVQSSTTSSVKSKSSSASAYPIGGIFQENGTSTSSFSWASSATTTPAATGSTAAASPTSKSESSATQGNGAIAGLIIAIVAAACIL